MSFPSAEAPKGQKSSAYDDQTENLSQSAESEEMRQLRDRIAELEGMHRMSSSTASFDVLAPPPNGDELDVLSFDHQNGAQHFEAIVDQLEKKFREKFANMEFEVRESAKQMITIANLKLENAELKNQQMQSEFNSLKLKVAELEEKQQQKMGQNERVEELWAKFDYLKWDVAQLKTAQKEIDTLAQQFSDSSLFEQGFPVRFEAIDYFIGVLKDKFGNKLLKAVHPDFRWKIVELFTNPSDNLWDGNAYHHDLEIIGAKSLMVRYKVEGNQNWPWRSVFAKHSIPNIHSGICYYEVKIVNMKNYIRIGFATKQMPWANKGVGDCSHGFAYDNASNVFCYGTRFGWKPRFGREDVIGSGVNLVTGRIIFTKNGKPLDTADLFASPPTDQLFPCVSLLDAGDLIEANFGPDFKFNPSDV